MIKAVCDTVLYVVIATVLIVAMFYLLGAIVQP
jgi:hypothetical protein